MSLLQWLSYLSLDFVAVQETHALSCVEATSWFSCYGYCAASSPGSAHSSGVAIPYRLKYSLTKSVFDKTGRFALAEFSFDGVSFRLVCLYASNRNLDRDDFFRFVIDKVHPAIPTVVVGDFNAVFDRSLDRRGSNVLDASHESFRLLRTLFDKCCIVASWRHLQSLTRALLG